MSKKGIVIPLSAIYQKKAGSSWELQLSYYKYPTPYCHPHSRVIDDHHLSTSSYITIFVLYIYIYIYIIYILLEFQPVYNILPCYIYIYIYILTQLVLENKKRKYIYIYMNDVITKDINKKSQ